MKAPSSSEGWGEERSSSMTRPWHTTINPQGGDASTEKTNRARPILRDQFLAERAIEAVPQALQDFLVDLTDA